MNFYCIKLASYYHKFIKAFAEKAYSLTSLREVVSNGYWGDEKRDAFRRIKTASSRNLFATIRNSAEFSSDAATRRDRSSTCLGTTSTPLKR